MFAYQLKYPIILYVRTPDAEVNVSINQYFMIKHTVLHQKSNREALY